MDLPKALSERLDTAAKQTGIAKHDLICAAIEQHLDDLVDVYLAEQVLAQVQAGTMTTHSLSDVEKTLGLTP